MAPHSSTLAWKIPWTEEPGRLQSMGSQRVEHDWATSLSLFTFMHWWRKWQPTPVFLPGESHGERSLVGYCPWGRKELNMTERLHFTWAFFALPFFGIQMKTDFFQSCGHCWVFQICWPIECSTFTASSFRIWNSSTAIPSPPLTLFIVMLYECYHIWVEVLHWSDLSAISF